MGNTIGHIFRFSSFGESHGIAVGGIIDGCPAGLKIDFDFIGAELARRKPGTTLFSSSRMEDDQVEFLSGIYEGVSLGTPIAFLIRNKDSNSADYEEMKNVLRPSHADYTYLKKYGVRDHRGGGRASARETAARVVAGAIAKLLLKQSGIEIIAYNSQIGNIILPENFLIKDYSTITTDPLSCPDPETALRMGALLLDIKQKGDTVGGKVNCVMKNVPAGIGEPVFGKLQAELAFAMMSINAAKGFEYGLGFKSAGESGSNINDEFISEIRNGETVIRTKTNYSGGIQGGIANGEDIYFSVAFKPVPTLMKAQSTINSGGVPVTLKPRGRHDVCVIPRVIPVVEAMAAMVLADQVLLNNSCRL